MYSPKANKIWANWFNDWNAFARDYLRVRLDPQQQEILHSVQVNPKTAVASGTSRGKDFVAACAGICFLYLTPRWKEGRLFANTKVIMTAPTDRQVGKIMVPEVRKIFSGSIYLPGYLVGYDIRTDNEEWYLTGFKADDKNTEAWSGYHAANIMFIVTEASGISETIFNAIEGNLQGNSRLLIAFNPNIDSGYAAAAMKSSSFAKFRLSSLDAPNVKQRRTVFPGQVNYEWIVGRIKDWCQPIQPEERNVLEADFEFEGKWYRPNDLFRPKVLGLFPKVSEGVLVPREWIELANERWKKFREQGFKIQKPLRLGCDIAGMGRDSSCLCYRYGDFVDRFDQFDSGGSANHMESAGRIKIGLQQNTDLFQGRFAQAFIDTIGEGAGVYSRLVELGNEKVENAWLQQKVHSCKFSESADWNGEELKDRTGQYSFINMRAFSYWSIRDWLNPAYNDKACLPPDEELANQLSQTQWKFTSSGSIQIESKEDLKKKIKQSPDKADALANTFWPVPDIIMSKQKKVNIGALFH